MGGADGRSYRQTIAKRRTSNRCGSGLLSGRVLGSSYRETEDPLSASISVPDDMAIDPAAVEVTGLPSDVDVTCLQYYMEISTDFTAKVVSILFRTGRRSAVVHFSQRIDLNNVKSFCSEVPLDDDHLFVKISEVAETPAIQICGLEESDNESYPKLIVENCIFKHSISTTISKVVMAGNIAVIALTSSTGCRLLLENMRRTPQHYRSVVPFYKHFGITKEADMISCTSSQPTAAGAVADRPLQATLYIGGFTKAFASEKHARLFFSNPRSGGSDCIEELLVEDKIVILRYSSNSVADRVIDKIAQRDLKFENDYLWVAVGWHRQHIWMDGSVFILRNLPEKMSRVALLYFLWAKACCRLRSLCFSLRRNVALIEFDQGVNFKSLYSAIADGEFFRGVGGDSSDPSSAARPIELLQIPLVTCLQFSGVPECGSEQYVELLVHAMCHCHAEVEAHMDSGACALRLSSQQEAFEVRFANLELESALLRVTPYHGMTGLTTEDEMSVAWLLLAPLALDFVEGSVLAHIVSSPAVRQALEEKLRLTYAHLVEPREVTTTIDGRMSKATASVGVWNVECLVADLAAASKGRLAPLREQWSANAMRVIEEFCIDFTCESIEFDARVWPRVQQFISASTSGVGDPETISLISEGTNDGAHRIIVVGRREAVQTAVERAVRQAATDSGDRTGNNDAAKQSDGYASSGNVGGAPAAHGCRILTVSRRELLYLQYRQLVKKMKAEVNASLVVTLQPSGRVSISGPEDTLQQASEYVQTLLGPLVHREVPLPAAAAQLMLKREGYHHIVTTFKAFRVSAFWERYGDVGIMMCADKAGDLERAISVVHNQLKTFDVKASDCKRSKAALNNPEFMSSVAEIQRQWRKEAVVIQLSADRLSAAAILQHARAIFDLSQLWNMAVELTHRVIHIDNISDLSLMRLHAHTLFGDKAIYMSFEEKEGGGSGEVIVSGPAALGSAICDDVYSALSRVRRSWLSVSGEPRVNWLTSPAGRHFLSASSRQGLTLTRCFKTERLANRVRPDGRRLVIVHGCALLQSGQCLMIGSNPKLELTASHTGQQLLHIDGPAVQNHIEKTCNKASLRVGDSLITIAGKRTYKGIIHVICPTYQPDPQTVSDDPLIFALSKGLKAASKKKYSSIVLPSIGSDGFGYPPDVGAELLVKALHMHFDKTPESSIRDVIVADTNRAALDFVFAAIEKSTIQEPTKEEPGSQKYVAAGGLLVEIVRGDIVQQQVNAVVNCMLSNGDLNGSGSASSRLSRAAGPELQDACRSLASGSQLDRGRVIVTKGYALPCQYVINICCGNRYDAVDSKVLSSYIAACLCHADEHRAESLAVPLLGVDTLNISASAIAQAIFSALSTYKARTLKAVYCVANDDASFEVFQAQRQEMIGSAKAVNGEDMVVTSSLCLEVLGLSKKDVEEAIAKVSAELDERDNTSNKGSDKV